MENMTYFTLSVFSFWSKGRYFGTWLCFDLEENVWYLLC